MEMKLFRLLLVAVLLKVSRSFNAYEYSAYESCYVRFSCCLRGIYAGSCPSPMPEHGGSAKHIGPRPLDHSIATLLMYLAVS